MISLCTCSLDPMWLQEMKQSYNKTLSTTKHWIINIDLFQFEISIFSTSDFKILLQNSTGRALEKKRIDGTA